MLKISVLLMLVVYAGTGGCQQSETRDVKICFNADEYKDALIETLSLTDEQASEVVNEALFPVRGKVVWGILAKNSYKAFKAACKFADKAEAVYSFLDRHGWWVKRKKRSVPENRFKNVIGSEDTLVTSDMIATLSAFAEGNSFCSTRRHMIALPKVSLNLLLTPFMDYEDDI